MSSFWTKALALAFIGVWVVPASAQDTIVDKDVDAQIEEPLEGPRADFTVFVDYGLSVILPGGEVDTIQNEGFSNYFWYGVLMQRNLGGHFGIGGNVNYVRSVHRVAQASNNPLNYGNINNTQKLVHNGLGVSGHVRLYLTNRGNNLGKYIDAGAYANYYIGERMTTVNDGDLASPFGAEEVETNLTKLGYVSNLEYGGMARIGLGAFYFFGKYRLSDLFVANSNMNDGVKLPEFERLSIGVGLSVFPD